METVIHQPFGNIVHGDIATVPHGAQVKYAFMGHHAVLAGIQDWVVITQPGGDVVCDQDGDQGRPAQSVRPHHGDIGPGDGQDTGRAPGRG